MAEKTGYSALQIGLHWASAFLIFGAFFSHENMGKALDAKLTGTGVSTPLHVYFGIGALVAVILRLIVRMVQGAPGVMPGTSPMMTLAAVWGHRLLYLLMFMAPIGGSLAWFGGLADVGDVHEIVGKVLMLTAVGHAVVAILHQALKGDGVLMRMFKPQP